MQINFSTNTPYTGNNELTLSHAPFEGNEWGTFIQWRKHGFSVQKGQRGTKLGRVLEYSTKNKAGKLEQKRGMRAFIVFNREQVAPVIK